MSHTLSEQAKQEVYGEGLRARRAKQTEHANPYTSDMLEARHWWYAGWHDEDIAQRTVGEGRQ